MILVLLLIVPVVSALLVLIGPKKGATGFATGLSLVQLGVMIWAYFAFTTDQTDLLNFQMLWVESPKVDIHFSMDGIAMLMAGMTNLTMPIILLSSNNRKVYRPRSFFFLVLFMQFALNGVFLANDGLLYYVFWELTLIPGYFILLYWGGDKKRAVTRKFFIYTLAGSLCMMLGFIYLYYRTGGDHSLTPEFLYAQDFTMNEQTWLFLAFLFAFAIKLPLVPFHSWQADTYHEAPAQGAMILAGLMAKMGLFSLVRWLIPVFPDALHLFAPWIIGLAVAGIIYGSIIAIWQRNLKRLFAYASLAHMGVMVAGVFSLTADGIEGSMVQAVAHGINTIGLFICADIIYSRMQTFDFRTLGGIRQSAPIFSTTFFIIVIATIALPFTNSFVSELVMLYGIYEYSPWLAAVATMSLVFGAIYMLRMFRKAMLGELKEGVQPFKDLTASEKWVLFPIVGMIFLFGIWYKPFFDLTGPAIEIILQNAVIPAQP